MSEIGSSQNSKIFESNSILKMFTRSYQHRRKPLKKEYIRVKLIRGLKKILRQLAKKEVPTRGLTGVSNSVGTDYYKDLSECFEKNFDIFKAVSRTEQGPLTDGKQKRRDFSHEKSYNNSFVKEFFQPLPIREALYHFVDIIFSDKNPVVLG